MSTEVKVLMTRRDMDIKTLAGASGVKVGRLGYLLRRERSWNIVEVEDVAQVFDLRASALIAMAEDSWGTGNVTPLLPKPGPGTPHPNLPSVTRYAEDEDRPAAESRDATDEADYEA